MGFQSEVKEESGYVQLHWTSTNRWTGEARQCENRITLTTRPQPFGGRRWFFICPHTGESVANPSGRVFIAVVTAALLEDIALIVIQTTLRANASRTAAQAA